MVNSSFRENELGMEGFFKYHSFKNAGERVNVFSSLFCYSVKTGKNVSYLRSHQQA